MLDSSLEMSMLDCEIGRDMQERFFTKMRRNEAAKAGRLELLGRIVLRLIWMVEPQALC